MGGDIELMLKDNSYAFAGLLSKFVQEHKTFAVCDRCRTYWVDDVMLFGSLLCPHCGHDTGHVLTRTSIPPANQP